MFFLLTALVFSQNDPVLGSMEWFVERLNEPTDPIDLSGQYVEFTERTWPVEGDSAMLEELAAQINGRPEHPRWPQYERLRRQLELDGFRWRYRIWFEDENRWRVSVDTDDPSMRSTFHDAARSSAGESWMWIRDSLTILDPSDPPDRFDPAGHLIHARKFVYRFLTPIGQAKNLDLSQIESSVDGRTWSAIARSSDGLHELRFTGRVVADQSSVDLLKIEHTSHPVTEHVGQSMVYAGWMQSRAFGRRLPESVTTVAGDGRLLSTSALIEARRLFQDEMESITRLPDAITGHDGIRDATLIREVIDRRPGRGTISDSRTGETTGRLSTTGFGSRLGPYYWIAWVLAAALLSGIVWLRMRR